MRPAPSGYYYVDRSSLHFLAAVFIGAMLLQWIVVLLMAAIVRFWEKRPLASVGIRRPSRADLLFAAAWWPLVFPIRVVLAFAPKWLRYDPVAMSATMALPFRVRLFLVLANPISEEFLFRGFVIERLEEMTGSIRIAAAVSLVANCLIHAGWGWGAVISVAPEIAALVFVYVRRRNLLACSLLHFLWDLPLITWG